MKKINLIYAVSPHEQQIIKRWYAHTMTISIALLVIMFMYTGITIYYMRLCTTHCVPCFSASAAQDLNKKYTTYKAQSTHQTHRTQVANNMVNTVRCYKTVLDCYIDGIAAVQLIDLQLNPTDVKITCITPQRDILQKSIDRLKQTECPAQVTLESLEKKNNTQGLTCTLRAQWKKITP